MAAGRTIISTTLGAEGIQYSDGRDILIADTPEDFATQILKCIDQPNFSKELGEHGQSLIARQYDYKTIGKKLMNFMLELNTESV
jgi:spore maturation protein CgeB